MKLQRTALALAMSVTGTLGVTLVAASPANAVQPVIQACVGTTHALLNPTSPPSAAGQDTAAFAQEPGNRPGIGDGIHDLQLGYIPDTLVPNTCNG
jgi:hypothetical protein